MQEILVTPGEVPEFVAAVTKVETTMLLALCSPDIEMCQLVTECIGLFLEGFRQLDPHVSDPSKTGLPMFRNGPISTLR